jgi:hypothetical protein
MGGAPTVDWLREGVGYEPEAAASMRRLEGRLGRWHDCNSSYRDWQEQMNMYLAWQRFLNGGPYPGHSRALHPDSSMHCRGVADDSDDWRTPGYNELAAEYGWIRTAADDLTERHHFEYQSWNDQHYGEPVPSDTEATPAEPIEKEDDMSLRIHHQVFTDGNQAFVVEDNAGFFIPDDNHRAALVKAYDINLDELPHLNEYDWYAVVSAKQHALAPVEDLSAQLDELDALIRKNEGAEPPKA